VGWERERDVSLLWGSLAVGDLDEDARRIMKV
jgi:hypothetical protein